MESPDAVFLIRSARMPVIVAALALVPMLLAGSPVSSQPADTLQLSLGEAMNRALEVSPEVAIMQADVAFAEARHRFARANRVLPEFQLNTAHAPAPAMGDSPLGLPEDQLYLDPGVRDDWSQIRPFNQVELRFGQPIYTWGELGRSIDAASHGADVARADRRNTEREVALRTAELYYGLQLAGALVRLADETGAVLQQAERELTRLLEEGDPRVDDAHLFQLQITEQEYERRLVEVGERQAIARAGLRRQLFLPDDVVLEPAEIELEPIDYEPEALDWYQQLALQNRPELQQAEAGLAAREALVGVARSDYYPKLFAGGSARISYTPDRPRQPNPYIGDPLHSRVLLAGLSFRQNLNFGITRARVHQAEAERDRVVHQQSAARQLILFEVENAYRQMRIARSALAAQDRALLVSREWLRTEQINFDLELGDARNLVDAVRENLELQASYYLAVSDYNIALMRLFNTTGMLTQLVSGGMLVEP